MSVATCFYYGDERICFERRARSDDADRVLIKVHPDCSVVVNAPQAIDDVEVLSAVKKRGRWIYQQLREFRKQSEYVSPRKYVSGESHYYLGKRYLLKVLEAPAGEQGVKLYRGKLEVTLRKKSGEKTRNALNEWYKSKAKEAFAARLGALLEQTLWVTERPQLRVMTMQNQWGSCSPKGRLTLNVHLIKAPRECIDYVILHELCHIAEHNHSERFYRLLKQVMPGWEKTKKRLDDMASQLIGV